MGITAENTLILKYAFTNQEQWSIVRIWWLSMGFGGIGFGEHVIMTATFACEVAEWFVGEHAVQGGVGACI